MDFRVIFACLQLFNLLSSPALTAGRGSGSFLLMSNHTLLPSTPLLPLPTLQGLIPGCSSTSSTGWDALTARTRCIHLPVLSSGCLVGVFLGARCSLLFSPLLSSRVIPGSWLFMS